MLTSLRITILAAAAALALAAPVPQGAATGLKATHPKHHVGGVKSRLQVPPTVHERKRRPVNPPASSVVLMQETRRLLTDFRLVKVLTRACRDQHFLQRNDRRYIAIVQGMTYGAGLGGHVSLRDPRGLGMPGMVYLFRNQDTSRCQVYLLGAPTANPAL